MGRARGGGVTQENALQTQTIAVDDNAVNLRHNENRLAVGTLWSNILGAIIPAQALLLPYQVKCQENLYCIFTPLFSGQETASFGSSIV